MAKFSGGWGGSPCKNGHGKYEKVYVYMGRAENPRGTSFVLF